MCAAVAGHKARVVDATALHNLLIWVRETFSGVALAVYAGLAFGLLIQEDLYAVLACKHEFIPKTLITLIAEFGPVSGHGALKVPGPGPGNGTVLTVHPVTGGFLSTKKYTSRSLWHYNLSSLPVLSVQFHGSLWA